MDKEKAAPPVSPPQENTTHAYAKILINVAKWSDADLAAVQEKTLQSLPSNASVVDLLLHINQSARAAGIPLERAVSLEKLCGQLFNPQAPKTLSISSHINANKTELDPGYGFHTLDPLSQAYLEELHGRAKTNTRLIQTADVGAGFGWMASLALISGSSFAGPPKNNAPLRGVRVTAFENHPPLLGKDSQGPVMQFVKQAKEFCETFAKSGARASDYSSVVGADAVIALGDAKRANAFDTIHLGRMIHCLSPVRADLLAKNLMSAAAPGGRVFASVHTALSFPDIEETFKVMAPKRGCKTKHPHLPAFSTPFEIYEAQHKAGAHFPGWMVLGMAQQYTPKGEILLSSFVSAQSLDESKENLSPVLRQPGAYASEQSALTVHKGGLQTELSYRSYQIYDSASFCDLFKRAGFDIEDVFYTDIYNRRIEVSSIGRDGRFTSARDTDLASTVCVIARKGQDLDKPHNNTH